MTHVTVHAVRERALVAGDDRAADSAVALVHDDGHARVDDRARTFRVLVGRAVVDDVHAVDKGGMLRASSRCNASSRYAGTTTATDLPSSISRGAARGTGRRSP
jgi:hypothetical protein